ncbi:MAG: aminotransferase class I/II-fold pyridoxal phosphate-dependent enzyme [Bacteroides sp.]|jgi:dTDP-4-amino-4,6-dideoxygalactose transaminase|nr:aminotransferase class I/II-fold pyridoxal phosphate-dependent enzyme [Bacteroides sp.]
MGDTEQVFVKEAFDTNWVAPLGPNVDGFEGDLQEYTGSAHAAALSSGTAALHLSLIMLGVKPGDPVICQSLTFSASANPIAYLGAVPVFVDSEPKTWNMCPNALEQAVKDLTSKGKKPKAIIPVHLYGMPAKMDEIMGIAQHFDIPIVEDAAEALGSEINGRKCGTFGKLGILSFNGNKIITTSGGGALLSDDEALIKKARFLATQARDPAPHYQHSHIGYNYRMSNVLAGIGRGQMKVLPQRIDQRRANFDFYQELLGGIPGIRFLTEPAGCFSNRWLTTMLIDPQETGGITREDIRQALEARNIESRPLWKPMHLQPIFKEYPYFGGQVAEKLFEYGLCMPSGSNMTAEEKERIAEVMKLLFHLK